MKLHMLTASVTREFKLIFRNGISLFMTLAPAILSLVLILIFGIVQSSTATLAVDPSVDADTEAKLAQVADLTRVDDFEALRARVESPDSVAGVYMENGSLRLLVEGNEGDAYLSSIRTFVGTALAYTGDVPFHAESVSSTSTAYRISAISVLLLSLFMGGATAGLSVVSERESGALHAVAVSPMGFVSFALSKLIPALILSLTGMTVAVLIMGRGSALPEYLLLVLCSVPVTGLMVFAVGGLAKNLLSAIGVMKLLMPLSMILPLSAIFVPERWRFLYSPLPMYWQYRAIDAVGSGADPTSFLLLTLAVGLPWFLAAALLFIKKTSLRYGR